MHQKFSKILSQCYYVNTKSAKAHLRCECFQETSYFVTKGKFDITIRLYLGRFLSFIGLLGLVGLLRQLGYKRMNQNKFVLESRHKNSWSFGNVPIVNVLSIEVFDIYCHFWILVPGGCRAGKIARNP